MPFAPVDNMLVLVFGGILLIFLSVLAYIDLKTFRLPDVLTFPLMGLGIAQVYFLYGKVMPFLIGAIAGYSIFLAIEILFKKIKGKDGLGRGDAKLLAAGGAWCGWPALPTIILIASLSGLLAIVFAKARAKSFSDKIPFGPFLALGIFAVWLGPVLTYF